MKKQYQNPNKDEEEKIALKDLKVCWKSDYGITMIALLIAIIIMVILTAVVIRSITGDDPIIGVTADTVEDHKIVSYKEQIEQTIHAQIVSKSAVGEVTTTGEVEQLLGKQDWVIATLLNPTATKDAGDVVVQTSEGYVFQAYYNNVYGYTDIEYIGRDFEKSKKLSINATYEKTVAQVYATSEEQSGSVVRHDLIHKYQVVGGTDNPSGQQKYNIKDIGTGWYKVKATSSSGATKFAWVRATNTKDALTKPTIEIETEGKVNNGWYGADKKDLWIKISTTSPSAKTIHYSLSGAHTQAEKAETVNGTGEKSVRFQITETGMTNIVAWTQDETDTYQSEEAYESVKFDNIPPVVTDVELEGTAGKNGWYISDVTLTIKAEDLNGKDKNLVADPTETIDGYNYTLLDINGTELKAKTHIQNLNTTLSTANLIPEDGIYVFHITTNDKAGNESTTKVVEVRRDRVAPTVGTPQITDITETGFTATATGEDVTSGIDYYQYYLNGAEAYQSTDGTWQATGLNPNQSYNITVKAFDRAGLSSSGSNNTPVITKGELLAPDVQISGNTRNGYYIGDVTISVRDTSDSTKTRVNKIKVIGAGEERTITGTSGSFTITADGTYTISAWSEDASGNRSDTTIKPSFTRDTTRPSASLSVGSKGTRTIAVTAYGSDTTSGIQSYKFEYKKTSTSTWTTATTKTTTETSCSYTYSVPTDGTTYNLRVTVTDNAGWTNEGSVSATTNKANTAPVVQTVTYVSKTTNSITVSARATDAENDNLTYTMYIRRNSICNK